MQDIYVGIDISKDKFDVAVSNQNVKEIKHSIFENNEKGYENFLKYLQKDYKAINTYIALESTGPYGIPLADYFTNNGCLTYVVNPVRVKYFAKGALYNVKTDKIDSAVILKFLVYNQNNLHQHKLPSEEEQELKELIQERTEIMNLLQQQKNRFKTRISSSKLIKNSFESIKAVLEESLENINQRMKTLVAENKELKEKSDILKSIKGVGDITSNTVISMVPEIGKIPQKQLVALVGLAPFTSESGKSKKKSFTRKGRTKVKSVLYMAALVASKHNPILKDVFQRLISKGKPFNVAITAVMRKLLVAMNALLTAYFNNKENS